MKFKNETDKVVSFQMPVGVSVRWFTLAPNAVEEIPEESAWRARAHGLTEVKEKKAVVKKAPVKKKSKKKR